MFQWLLMLAASTLQLHKLHLQIEYRGLQQIVDHFRWHLDVAKSHKSYRC